MYISKEKQIKTINIMTIIAITLLLCVFILPVSYANDDAVPRAMAEQILKGAKHGIYYALNQGDFQTWAFDNNIDTAGSGRIKTFMDALKILGCAYCMAVAISHMIQNIERGMDPFEAIYKVFVELMLSVMLIISAEKLCTSILGVGKGLATDLLGGEDAALEVTRDQIDHLLESVAGEKGLLIGGWIWWLKAFAMLFFPFIGSLLIEGAAMLAVYQILFEIVLRRIFMPLAIGDIYQEGLRSPGMRYLKKLFACVLKLSVCVVIALILNEIQKDGIGGGDEGFATMGEMFFALVEFFVINLVAIGLMFKSGEIVNDAVDV